jgi:type I restriction enzyme S subunit
MIEENELPKAWKLVKLREVLSALESGKRPKGGVQRIESGIPSIGAEHLNNEGGFKFSKIKFVPKEFADSMQRGKIRLNDIIVVKDGATTGKTSFVGKDYPFDNSVINEHVFICRAAENADSKYIFYNMFSEKGKNQILEDFRGAAQGGISSKFVDLVKIPLPPLPEQQRIVAKLEELLSELEKGKEQLHTALDQLKVYRQAVLKNAFEGKLTSKAKVTNGELPKDWKWVKLGELMESVRNGYSKKPDDKGSYKILRISSVRPNSVNIEDVRFLEKGIGDENLVRENDLLFTRYNGSRDFVGVCGRVRHLSHKLFYPDKLIRCRPHINEVFHSAYLEYASNSGVPRRFVLSKLKTTAGQTGISGNEVKQIPIPLAPIEEQHCIVEEIESRLSVADKLEETITASLQQSETLRQSILKKAFEGKLG